LLVKRRVGKRRSSSGVDRGRVRPRLPAERLKLALDLLLHVGVEPAQRQADLRLLVGPVALLDGLPSELHGHLLHLVSAAAPARHPVFDHRRTILVLLVELLREVVEKSLAVLFPMELVVAPERLVHLRPRRRLENRKVVGVIAPAVSREVGRAGHAPVRPVRFLKEVDLGVDGLGGAGVDGEAPLALEVFEAVHEIGVLIGEPVAVVLHIAGDELQGLKLELVEQLQEEARRVAVADHPHLAGVFEVVAEGLPALDGVEGEGLGLRGGDVEERRLHAGRGVVVKRARLGSGGAGARGQGATSGGAV